MSTSESSQEGRYFQTFMPKNREIEISMMEVGDIGDSLRRISCVINMLTYIGETGSQINPEHLVGTIQMIRDSLDQQIDNLESICNGKAVTA